MKTPTKTMLRAFAPADYVSVIAVNRASYPDYTESLEEWRHWDESWDSSKYFKERVVAEDGGRVVGWGQVSHMPWQFLADKYRVDVTVLPEQRRRGHGSALHGRLLATVRARGAIAVQASAKESMADGVAFLSSRGYRERKRDWESRLFVRKFDFARFAGADERVTKQGIRITTLAAEKERDLEALRKAYDLSEDCSRDVPSVDPPTPRPYEEWMRNVIEAPNHLPEAYFIAIDTTGRYLGVSDLFSSLDDPTFLWQGLTGVRREARGKGIAMALKLRTVRYALDRGVEHIKTWNDQRNRPMLSINETLGFERQPAWIVYEKELSGSSQSGSSS
jgi:GNAT superfamily N-acetyltransferase